MKKISAVFVLSSLLIGGRAFAQSKDTVPAKKVIEQGTKGDIIIGNENKRKQLNATLPVQQRDSAQKAAVSSQSKKRKCKNKTSKN